MADEATTPVVETETKTTETQAAATSSDATKNTETVAETMIPKSRFDEVNNRLKALEGESTKVARAAKEAETKRLEEEGKYKELFEKQQAELSAAQQAAKASELKLLRQQVATETKLPALFAERLRGETYEEMVADAKVVLAALPKPEAPNINAQTGTGGAPAAGQLDDAEKRRLADKYGVDARYIQ